ncbi:ROK family protein, partial [Streptomyces sp. NPDC059409]|uniref:ROK family protein n=1 Tax=Streptomyces sp. NPDC059409 TaxID=3346824 RepID=UPI00368B26A9
MSGADAPVFAGVDIGGTTTQVVLCDRELKVLDRAEVATPARSGGRAMIDAVLDALAVVRARTPGRTAAGGGGA